MPLHESETLELKRSTAELEEAMKSIVAILNKHQNGELYFGLKDNGDAVGQDVSEKTLRDIAQAISQKIEPKIFPKINLASMAGKDCIHVQFDGSQVPYFHEGRAYLRVGTTDQQVSVAELRRIFSTQTGKEWDKQPSDKRISDVNTRMLRSFMRHAKDADRINFAYKNAGVTLKKLKLMHNNRLLRAGEVLFCNDNPIEVQAAVFAGTDKLTFLDIRQIKGTLFDVLLQSMDYLKDRMNWRGLLSGDGRKEIPEIPLRALEEALANSLVHRDYTTSKSNEIRIFKDRIEIYNPGQYLPSASPEEYITGDEPSIPRNPLIADILFSANVIEKWGSGFKRIHDACKEAGVKVEFKEVDTGFKVVFWRPPEWVAAKDLKGSEQSPRKVPEKSQKILDLIEAAPGISRQTLAERLGLPVDTVQARLRRLIKDGRIRRVGPDKGGHWEIIKKP